MRLLHNFNRTVCPLHDNHKQKSMKQVHVTKNILYEKVGGIYSRIEDLKAIVA